MIKFSLKSIFWLSLFGFVGLSAYAIFGDLDPVQTEQTLQVEIDLP